MLALQPWKRDQISFSDGEAQAVAAEGRPATFRGRGCCGQIAMRMTSSHPGGNGSVCESRTADTRPLQPGLKVLESIYSVPQVRAEEFRIRACSTDPNKQTWSLTSATITPDPPSLPFLLLLVKIKWPIFSKGSLGREETGYHFLKLSCSHRPAAF